MATGPDTRSKRKALLILIPIVVLVFVLLIAISYWRAEEDVEEGIYQEDRMEERVPIE